MDHDQLIAAYEAETRAKYTDSDREDMAKAGQAMEGGSYPIKDEDDLSKAIHAVGRGNAGHDAIRKHIITRAAALKLSSLIPDNWNADGSLKAEAKSASTPLARSKKPRHRAGLAPTSEFRVFATQGLEVRSATDDSNTIEVTGEPIVYNTDYPVRDMYGEFTERMEPGVATGVIAEGCDTRFLFNHGGLPLARTLSGTLKLTDTPTALRFSAHLDTRQQLANDLAIAIERGDVSQMSCGFIVAADTWSDNETRRAIHTLKRLSDVSAVTYPASDTTSIQVAQRMMFAAPVESRARIRRMWSVSRDIREGRSLTPESAELLSQGLEALYQADEDTEDRAEPTDQDSVVTKKLAAAHSAVHDLIQAQTADPDNGTDPADSEVWKHIQNAQVALTNASKAQSVDNAPEETEQAPAEGQDGTEGDNEANSSSFEDGTGSRSLELELELIEIRRRRLPTA